MSEDNNELKATDGNEEQNQGKEDKPLTFHNPLNPNDPRKITLKEVESEQKFKEALTERD